MSRFAAVLLAAAGSLAFLAVPAQAITNGQIDTFSGGLANWWGYSSYEVLADGGPNGSGDAYLHNYSDSISGWLSVSNMEQWAGNYTSAGVTALEVDLFNQGSSPLLIRAYVSGLAFPGAGGEFASTTPLVLPADGQWHHVVLGLTAADLTFLPNSGNSNIDLTLQNVRRLSLRHQVNYGDSLGSQILGSWRLDNIKVAPEPTTWVSLLLLGALVLSRKI